MRIFCNKPECQRIYNCHIAFKDMNPGEPITFKIYYKNQMIHNPLIHKKLPVTGVIRKEMLAEGLTTSANVLRDKNYEKLTNEQKNAGNDGFMLTKSNTRKIRSLALCNQDLDPDDFIDLLKRYDEQKKKDKFIQFVGLRPFYLTFFRNEHINVVVALKEKFGYARGHFDGTGCVVRKTEESDNKQNPINYHALVFRLPPENPKESGNLFALAGLLTDNNSQSTLTQFLQTIAFMAIAVPRPFMTEIVSDNCRANINAILFAFNSMTLLL